MKAGRLGILSVGLVFSLSACDIFGGGGPAITSFSATPQSIAAGQPSVLAWAVDSSATTISINNGVGTVTSDTDDRVTVTPAATTTYTLTATNAENRSTTRNVTVTVASGDPNSGNPGPNPGPDPAPDGLPTGTFGVSTSATGPFTSDADGVISSNTDERIVSVTAPGTFYAQVAYTDTDGIDNVVLRLVNDAPVGLEADLPAGGFTAGAPTGNSALASGATTVTCVNQITAGTVDIEDLQGAGSEFAYVFRAIVTDTLGNTGGQSNRGYVNIQ